MKESFVLRLNFFAFPFTRPHYTVTSTNLQLKESHQYTAAAAAVPGRRRWHALSFVPLCPFQHARVKRWCQLLCFRPRQTFHLVALPLLSQIPEESILDHLDLWPIATLSREKERQGKERMLKNTPHLNANQGWKEAGGISWDRSPWGLEWRWQGAVLPLQKQGVTLSLAGEPVVLGTTPSETKKNGKRVLFISTCKKLNPRLRARLKAASVYFIARRTLEYFLYFPSLQISILLQWKKKNKVKLISGSVLLKANQQLMSSNVAISRKSVSSQTWNYSLLSVPTIKSIELTTSESHRWNGQLFQHNCPRRNVWFYSNYLTTAEMLSNKVVVTTTTAIVKQAAIILIKKVNRTLRQKIVIC